MLLRFFEIFIISSIYASSTCMEVYEKGAEILKKDVLLGSNESSDLLDNSWLSLLENEPVAILLELREPLLKKIKGDVENEYDIDNKSSRKTTLATFDSKGLQKIYFYNDTFEFRKGIQNLEPTSDESNSPTFHALANLLRSLRSGGSILLATMSKPSDEDFLQNVEESLTDKNLQLSVLWAGEQPTNEYLPLKNITESTGGKFIQIMNENKEFGSSNIQSMIGQVKFPENEHLDEGPMVSRTAPQKVIPKLLPLIVEVASGSTLEVRPGTPTQIQFTVKNNINVVLPVYFNAKYNGIIQNVQPPQTVLQPASTITVIVNLQPIGAPQNLNAAGTVTLIAVASNRATARSALIWTTPHTITDYTAPKMTYKYDGDCANYKEPQNCENGIWHVDVTFHDEDSGLLKVLSEPYGLLFHSEFIAGIKNPVTVKYSATCCQPIVQIWAEDLKGNIAKKSFDVFNQSLLAGEITSIVLGVVLLLFIIIAIIVAVVLVRRRNQRNLIIPRARSGSR